MIKSNNALTTANSGNVIEAKRLEVQHRKEKARSKANFTCTRNSLLLLLKELNKPNCHEVRAICKKMNGSMEEVMEVLSNFTEFYLKNGQLQCGEMVVCEMETIEKEFYSAYEAAQAYLDSIEGESSSVPSVDLHVPQESEVNSYHLNSSDSLTVKNLQPGRAISNGIYQTEANTYKQRSNENTDLNIRHQFQAESANEQQTIHSSVNHFASPVESNVHHKLTESSTVTCGAASLGNDLWQLKRIQIPVFSGDKRTYQSWKAAFVACIDRAPATAEYKLLQLRQYLAGNALKAIENLGHSSVAYEAAKERLERKYGGRRRQIANNLEELENFRQIQIGNTRDLEEFSDLLEIAIINLTESGQDQELGNGCLYTMLQRKLPESMLARYHRWIFEHNHLGSVLTLRTWVIEESEFQTVASETVNGVTGSLADTAKAQSLPNYDNPRTFFIDQAAVPTRSSTECEPCPVCEGLHYVWNCRNFIENSTSDRWKIAKRFQLCFRCLTEGHHGKSCQRSSQCGQNGCLELHHRLLHRQHKRNSRGSRTKPGVLNRNNNNHLTALQFRFPEQFISIMEGNDRCTEGNDRCTEGNKLYTEGNDRCMEETDCCMDSDHCTDRNERFTDCEDRCTEGNVHFTEGKDRCTKGKEYQSNSSITAKDNTCAGDRHMQ